MEVQHDAWQDIVHPIESEDLSMVSQSIGQEAGTHGHDSVRYSFEFMPDQRRTFELKVRNKGFNRTQRHGGAFNTVDSATRSTA